MREAAALADVSPSERPPPGWRLARIGEVGEVRLGRQRSPQHENGRFVTPYLRVANVFDGYIDYADVLSMNFSPREREIYGLRGGDLLLNEGQSLDLVGRCAIYTGTSHRYCYQNTLVRYRCGPELMPNFAFYTFQRWLATRRFVAIAKQTTSIAHLGADRFAGMTIALPPLQEQRRIADILGSVDESIRSTERLIAKLEALSRSVLFQAMLSEVGEPTRPLGQYLLKIDAGWSPACDEVPPRVGEWGVLKVNAVTGGVFEPRASKRLPPHLPPKPDLEVRDGDVVLARANGVAELVGVTVEARRTPSRLMLSDKTLRLVPKEGLLTKSFLTLLLGSHGVRRQIMQMVSGSSGQKNISQAQINGLAIVVPSIEVQTRTAAANYSFLDRIEVERRTLAKLRELKQGLMEDLLTGRTRVKVGEDVAV